MKKKLLYILINVILSSILVGLVAMEWIAFSATRKLCKADERPIQYKRLSDEKWFPFLLLDGRPLYIWEKRPDYDRYSASIVRFPTVRSCLVSSERGKQAHNLARFDWDVIKTTYDADVCLFRIFSSIGSAEGAEQWLEDQGFRVHGIDRVTVKDSTGNDIPGIHVSALWDTKKCGVKFRSSVLDELYHYYGAHEISASVWFTPNEEVYDTHVSYDML